MHLYDIPMVFILIGLTLYVVLGGADFGAASCTATSASATTRTTRWRRCGRPTTCG
jgi:cytochrome bd-type quinol oxidase subunit 2